MPATTCTTAQEYIQQMSRLLKSLNGDVIDAYTDLLHKAWKLEQKVYIFGNGGSASTASHHVLDLIKTAAVEGQPRLRAICLNDNVGMTTAVGNDMSYDETFAYPLSAFAEAGDIAVAISCSGNSPNVVRACEWAREHHLSIVTLTGFTGGRIAAMSDINIHVPSDNYGLVEDLHLSVGHIVAQSLRARVLAGENVACRS